MDAEEAGLPLPPPELPHRSEIALIRAGLPSGEPPLLLEAQPDQACRACLTV